MVQSLWPDNIGVIDDSLSPFTLLQQQAHFLGERTQNLLKAEVSLIHVQEYSTTKQYIYQFNLVAPLLDNYRFGLFHIRYPVGYWYPVIINDGDQEFRIESAEALNQILRGIFFSKKTEVIVQSLIIHSKNH